MDKGKFYQLKEELSRIQMDNFECGINETPGLLIDYQNNQGERKQFIIRNITSSPYNGCFEADCFSEYRATMIEEQFGFNADDFAELAVTSHRTFKIDNIISAKIR